MSLGDKIGYTLNMQCLLTFFCGVSKTVQCDGLMNTYPWIPSITDGVHLNENLVEIISVFSTFSNFFKKEKRKNIYIIAILCNFSMWLLKYF